ncbi:beta-barrel assembly-enhancing protease [mine drainage metagenome]|uniref:Beta-barrel assembly-enhancing protease n=1 Tax=mine drainage metagenome TaxID=410659 RepID=A0A1J5R1V3_9ZZZZ
MSLSRRIACTLSPILNRLGYPLSIVVCFMLAALALPARADELQDASRLLKQGQQAEALEKTDQYLSGHPKDAQGRFLKGLILTEMHRNPEAIAVFTKLTEDYPQLPEPYNNLAVIYAQQKQYDKARQALETAIRTNPSYATARENLGDIYARMASQAYDKALQIDSSNTSAQTKLALIRELMSTPTRPGQPVVKTPGIAVAVATPPAKPVRSAPIATKPASPKPTETKPAAAKPAAAPTAEAKPAPDAKVDRVLAAWAQAWSRKNVKAYLAFYARDFKTPRGMSRAAWEKERAMRINKPGQIQVGIEHLRITTDGAGRAVAKFRQHYRSASFKTSSNKVIVLAKHEGKWLIQQERVGK